MKKRLLSLLFIFIAVIIIPRGVSAADIEYPDNILELNFPSNYVDMMKFNMTCSLRERFAMELIGYYSHAPYISNLETNVNILGYSTLNNMNKFYILPGIAEEELVFNIPYEFRRDSNTEFGVDIFSNYGKIKINVMNVDVVNNDLVFDFNKYNDYFDIPEYFYRISIGFSQLYDDGYNTPIIFNYNQNGVNGSNEDFIKIASKEGKTLFLCYGPTSSTPFKIIIPDNVTYLDNIYWVLDDNIKEAIGFSDSNLNSIKFVFAHEPEPENTNESKIDNVIKNIKNNPKTYNNVLIALIVSICALVGFKLVRKYKNN